MARQMAGACKSTTDSESETQTHSRKPKTGEAKRRSNDRRKARKEKVSKSQKAKREEIADARRFIGKTKQAVPGKKRSPAKKKLKQPKHTFVMRKKDSKGTPTYSGVSRGSIRSQRQSMEFQKGGYDDRDGPELGENQKEIIKKPGYIFVQQKIDSDGTPTNNYKIDVRSEQYQKPPKVVDCGSFSLKLVPRSCYHVVCIIKTTEAMSTKLSEYSNDNEGDGWYTLTTQEDFNKFMAVFSDTARKYCKK